MVRLISGLAFASILSVSVLAQNYEPTFPGCAKCGVRGWVDMPARGVSVSRVDLQRHAAAFEGWGFECVSGQPVDRAQLAYEDETGAWHMLKQKDGAFWGGYIPRPDVVTAFASSCAGLYSYGQMSGWILWIDNPPPAGARRVIVQLWRGPYHQDVTLTLNITE